LEIRRNKKTDRKTKKILTMCKMHHTQADIGTLAVSNQERRREEPVTN
jgi:hypothetical protein